MQDLCARLPYGVKLGFYASATNQTHICTLLGIEPDNDEPVIAKTENGSFYMLADHIKPYLYPLSSITEEQKKELQSLTVQDSYGISYHTIKSFDYLYKNHIDAHGLIPTGLAIDATGLNIY